jgi:hypothetical protein
MAVGGAWPSSSASELDSLLDEFEMSLRDVLGKVNPLRDSIKEDDEDRYISEGADKSRRAIQAGRPTKVGAVTSIKR